MSERTATSTGRRPRRGGSGSTAILVSLVFLGLFLVLPLVAVFVEALRNGVGAYLASFQDPDALAAIRLTLTVAAIAVPLNLVFGIAASWAIAKFDFKGKSLLITLIDLPFSVSPVVAGPRVRAAVRSAGLARAVAEGPRDRDHFCACRESSSRRCSSRSRSSRAS